jgi:hypothetical protein
MIPLQYRPHGFLQCGTPLGLLLFRAAPVLLSRARALCTTRRRDGCVTVLGGLGRHVPRVPISDTTRQCHPRTPQPTPQDRPKELGDPKFLGDGNSKTDALMLRMAEPLFGTGSVLMFDSGFCSINGMVQLAKRGVYSSCVIKKKKYWPKGIDGDEIESHMAGKAIGVSECRQGTKDGVKFHLTTYNDSTCNCKMMATFGTNTAGGKDRFRYTEDHGVYKFKYNEVVANWYEARPGVDHHNLSRMGWIDLTTAWAPRKWSTRQFVFFIATAEVNAMYMMYHFKHRRAADPRGKIGHAEFRVTLAEQFLARAKEVAGVDTELDEIDPRTPKRRRMSGRVDVSADHQLKTFPKNVKGWDRAVNAWDRCKKEYQEVKCSLPDCHTMTRKYCACDKSVPMCRMCHAGHILMCQGWQSPDMMEED